MYFISQRRPLFDEPCPVCLSPPVPDNRDLPTGGNPRLFQSKSGLGEHFSRPQRCVVLPLSFREIVLAIRAAGNVVESGSGFCG